MKRLTARKFAEQGSGKCIAGTSCVNGGNREAGDDVVALAGGGEHTVTAECDENCLATQIEETPGDAAGFADTKQRPAVFFRRLENIGLCRRRADDRPGRLRRP